MILQALTLYYQRLLEEGKAAPPGFQNKPIPFIIVLDKNGSFLNLIDTTSANDKKGRICLVPREVIRSGTKAWQKANLLWDNLAYVLGYSDDHPDDARKKNEAFIDTLKNISLIQISMKVFRQCSLF